MIKRIISIVISLLVLAWVAIVFYDYYLVSKEEKPKFCIKEEDKKYDDGTTYECVGLGYKVYIYNRTNMEAAYEFGPFFIDERQP